MKNCCQHGVYWMRVVNHGGEATDIAVRATSEQEAWQFICQPDTWQAADYTLLPAHPGKGTPAGKFRPRWEFDAGAAMTARVQYLRYIHRARPYGVMGRSIRVTQEMP